MMTEPEDFLSRWARRKRAAGAEPETKADAKADTGSAEQTNRDRFDASDQVEQDAARRRQTPAQTRDAKPDDAFDLSTLPSLDSIGPTTDIRVFMQPGVPAALSRAALRRAWSADAGIREFVGLAENSWDFTAGDGMHGFGALDPADAKRLLAQFFSESDRKDDVNKDDLDTAELDKDGVGADGEIADASPGNRVSAAEAPQDDAPSADAPSDDAITSDAVPTADIRVQPVADGEAQQSDHPVAQSVALQQEIALAAPQQQKEEPEPARSRSHGRALPR